MAAKRYAGFCSLSAGLGTLLVLGTAPQPAAAQDDADRCASLAGAERVACLRTLLAETQAALARAERDLETPSAAAQPGAATQPTMPPGMETLGAEQAARRTGAPRAAAEEAQRFAATIVSSQRTPLNRLEMRLGNGQVWRQIQSDMQVVDLPADAPVAVEIWRSGFGGYRMRLTELGRTLKVERLR